MERRNVRSSLSQAKDTTVAAHTRNRTVLRPVVPLSLSSSETVAEVSPIIWTGSMIDMGKLQKSMNQASKDYIAEGKIHQFPVCLNIPNPDDRTRKLISRPIQPGNTS